jgi:hypothetical protein
LREDVRVTEISTVHGPVREGSTLTYTRRYAAAELREYDALVGRPAEEAGLLPDLLVIAPLTKLGGDLNYLSRTMRWSHHRAVRADEELTAELQVTRLDRQGEVVKIAFEARIKVGAEVVLSGTSRGVVLGA